MEGEFGSHNRAKISRYFYFFVIYRSFTRAKCSHRPKQGSIFKEVEPTESTGTTIDPAGTWPPTEHLLPTGPHKPIFSGEGETTNPIARIINRFSKMLNYGYHDTN